MKYVGKLYGKVAGKCIELDYHSEQVEQLTKEKKEFIERYKDLLDEAMNNYPYIPYAYRKPVEEYYQEEIKYLEGLNE
jgi:hypothetical protein